MAGKSGQLGRFRVRATTAKPRGRRRRAGAKPRTTAKRLPELRLLVETLIDVSNDPVIILDRRDLIAHCNRAACRVFGIDEAMARGKPFARMFDRDDPDIRTLSRHLTGSARRLHGKRFAFAIGPKAHRRHFDVLLSVFDRDGNQWRAASLRDVTAQHKARAALARAKSAAQAASRAKTNFLAKSSHEVRTPLNAIVGFSDAILHGVHGPLQHAKYASYVKDIHAAAVHLLALIDDTFDIARIEAGHLRLCEAPIDVVKLVSSTVSFIQPIAANAGVEIVFEFKSPHLRLTADERRVRQVLINVLSNAIKFSPHPGQVRVTVLPTAVGGLAVVVADSGAGIDPRLAAKIGTEFVTSAGPGGGPRDGTGLGLAVSIALMRAHGGDLRIESAAGAGTTVRLIFPPERVSAAHLAEQGARTGRPRSSRVVGAIRAAVARGR